MRYSESNSHKSFNRTIFVGSVSKFRHFSVGACILEDVVGMGKTRMIIGLLPVSSTLYIKVPQLIANDTNCRHL